MDKRLLPLNALLALVRGDGGWPTPFRTAGYRVHLLEARVQTAEGLVVADAVLCRGNPPEVVPLCEAKGGANVEDGQARKYSVATALSLERPGSAPQGMNDETRLPLVYVCLEEHRARIEFGLARLKIASAVLSVSSGQVVLTGGALLDMEDFVLPVPGPPPAIIAIDALSPIDEVRAIVRPIIVAAMVRQQEVLDIRAVCREAVRGWDELARGAQNDLRRRVIAALREIERTEMRREIAVETGGAHEPRLRILRTPERFDPRGRTQGYQRLRRRAAEAAGQQAGVHPDQLSFEELAEAGGLEEN